MLLPTALTNYVQHAIMAISLAIFRFIIITIIS